MAPCTVRIGQIQVCCKSPSDAALVAEKLHASPGEGCSLEAEGIVQLGQDLQQPVGVTLREHRVATFLGAVYHLRMDGLAKLSPKAWKQVQQLNAAHSRLRHLFLGCREEILGEVQSFINSDAAVGGTDVSAGHTDLHSSLFDERQGDAGPFFGVGFG